MSTSCIIALYSKKEDQIVLLEKTHDGFEDLVANIFEEANEKNFADDIEEMANYLIKNTDIEFAIYSHKYPQYAFLFEIDENVMSTIQINPQIKKISECLEDIEKVIKRNNRRK